MYKIANDRILNPEAIAAAVRTLFRESERGDAFLLIKEALTLSLPFTSIDEIAKAVVYNATSRNLDIVMESEQAKREAKIAESQTPDLF